MTLSLASVRRDALSASASNVSIRVSRGAADRGARWSRAALRSSSCAGGLFALSLLSQAMAQALPGTASIVSGQADIARTANSVTITQGTQKLITNWTDFSVGAGNAVRFVQPNADAVALNRVTGTTLSTIAGTISGNGRVFLVNPNGVLMSGTANVSLGSLVVSTQGISNNDFLAGNYRFADGATAAVTNQGSISASTPNNDAYILLVATGVSNEGTLNAGPRGRVALAAGNVATLVPDARDWVRTGDGALTGSLNNTGSIQAPGGEIRLLLHADSSTLGINQGGLIRADNLVEGPGGRIVLDAGNQRISTSGVLNASGNNQGGRVEMRGSTIEIGGDVRAMSDTSVPGTGGDINIAASGDLKIGNIAIDNSGKNGGSIQLQAGRALQLGAYVNAAGTSQGGSMDIAAGTSLTLDTTANLRATYEGLGAGSMRITAPSLTVGASRGANQILASDLRLWLDGHRSTVDLRAAQDLTLASNVSSDTAQGRLSLTAGRSVLINSAFLANTTPVTIVANAKDSDLQAGRGTGQGAIRMASGASIDTKGAVSLKVAGNVGDVNAGEITLTTLRAGALSIDSPVFAGTATARNKVYDGTVSAPLATAGLTGLTLSGSNLQLATTSSFADKAVGTGKEVTVRYAVTGFDRADTSRSAALLRQGNALTVTSTADITPRTLHVSQLTGTNKVYDGLTTASAQIGADDRVQGDQLTLSAAGRFADKNVGAGKQITIQSVKLDGADAANYTVDTTDLTALADITPRRLNLIGAYATDKTYDGTTAATVNFARDDRVAGDELTAAAQGRFSSKDVGTNKRVQVGNVTLSGTDAGNYEATTSELFTAADITRRNLTVSELTGQTKVYDGTRAAQVTVGRDDRITGDDLQIAATGSFDTKQAGSGKRIDVQSLTLSGASAGNYIVSATGLTATGTIDRRTLLLSGLTASDKIYDGNTTAQVSFARDDRVVGDNLRVTATGVFADKRAAFNKQVTASASLAGDDAGNYVVAMADSTTQASILQRALTLTDLTATSRVYDGTRAATVSYGGNNRLSGDQLTVNATAQFDNAHAGTGKQVTITQVNLSGTDAGNYRIDDMPRTTTADITRRSLVVSGLVGQNKVYDGTRVAQVQIGSDNRVAGDELQFSAIASFDSKQAGTGKRITVEDIRLSGANAGDYAVQTANLFTTANIQRRVLVLSGLAAQDKTYDGNAVAQVNYARNDRVAGDQVQVSAVGSFNNKQAGTNKLVTVNGVTLSGIDADNYVVEAHGDTTRATIDPRLLTLGGLTASDKVYDGNRVAQTRYTTDDRVAGDELQIHTAASFDDKYAGTGKTVTVNQIGLTGADAGNYRVEGVGATTTATIDQRLLTLTQLAALDKVYDQTVRADVSAGGDDRVRGDQLTVALTGDFDTRHVGRDKTVTVTGIHLSGADASNYRVTDEPLTTQASITPRTLKVGVTASDKIYDGQRNATVVFQDDRLKGDDLQLLGGTSRFADANAGKNKTVTASGWQLTGDDAGNYLLDAPSWQTTANIAPRVLHVTAPSSVEFSKSLRPQTLPIGHDALAIDPIQVVAGSLRWGPADGLPRAAMLGDFAIQGAGAGNYVLDVPTLTTVAIVKAPLPLPGTGGEWLCTGPGRGCGSVVDARPGTAGALPGLSAEAGMKPSAPALVVRQRGIQVPVQHLMEDGE